MDEVETAQCITEINNMLNLVYANHLHRVISSTTPEQCSIIEHFDLCLDYINEINQCNIPECIRNAHVSKVCCVDWCETELKTSTWKTKIHKMTRSMLRVEDWLIKSNVNNN